MTQWDLQHCQLDVELFPSEGNRIFGELIWQGEAFLRLQGTQATYLPL